MRADERNVYRINQSMAIHNVDLELEPVEVEDFEHESLNLKEIEALQAIAKSPKTNRLK